MAQSDANEQVKEILRQLIKHRFWIAIGFASLFAVIAYFMGSGPVQAKAKTEIDKINGAEKAVKAFALPSKPTADYKPIVVEKTEIMSKDVIKAWKELYDRQAPLLTWPERARDNIAKWGRKWPAEVDPTRVQVAIVDYIESYPAYVDMVYKTFDPFDFETGKGIVAAPPREVLLRPAPFVVENNKLPSLGKIWAAQERLWIQRTMLEVVHQVNKNAKDWDTAVIKELLVLEVGNPAAQDQRSLAKGEQLTEAADILSPEQEAAKAAETTDAGGGGGGAGGGQMGARMGMMMSGMGGGRPGGAAKAEEGIYYITPADDKGQYKILPVMITALVEQDRVQDLLVELENSPMSIQVKDLELERPASQVTKPEKGEARAGMGLMGGMGGSMMMRGFGGRASQMRDQMMQMGSMGGRGMMGGQAAQRGGGMGMFAGGGVSQEKKGVDVRNVNREAERKKKLEEIEKRKGPSLFDPYFNIVQVTVYGQARFYNPPPVEEGAEPSPGEAATTPASPGAAGANPPATLAPAAEKAKNEAPAAAGTDANTTKAQPGAGSPPAKPAEEKPAAKPSADASKPAAGARPGAPGTDASKSGTPGTDASKSGAPGTDASKSGSPAAGTKK